MATLKISYRSGDDEITERVISELSIESNDMLNAYCELRGRSRSFRISRIEAATDLNSGEVIEDVWLVLGLRSQKRLPSEMPVFDEVPKSLTLSESSSQRQANKWNL